jgi:hypothetical protein
MTPVEKRLGFEMRLERPPSAKSLWAALVTSRDPLAFAKLRDGEQVLLAYTCEAALSHARAIIDELASDSSNNQSRLA